MFCKRACSLLVLVPESLALFHLVPYVLSCLGPCRIRLLCDALTPRIPLGPVLSGVALCEPLADGSLLHRPRQSRARDDRGVPARPLALASGEAAAMALALVAAIPFGLFPFACAPCGKGLWTLGSRFRRGYGGCTVGILGKLAGNEGGRRRGSGGDCGVILESFPFRRG